MAKIKLDKTLTQLSSAEVEGFFLLKRDDGTAIGNASDFFYFEDPDRRMLQGNVLAADFNGDGDFSAGSAAPNTAYINVLKTQTAIFGQAYSQGANDRETELNAMDAALAKAGNNAHLAFRSWVSMNGGGAVSPTASFGTPPKSESFLEILAAPAKPFHGTKKNVIDILNSFYGFTTAEQKKYAGVENFASLFNKQDSFQVAVTQTIGSIFTDVNLMDYYKNNAPWWDDTKKEGGSISGTLYNYRNITGLSGQFSGLEHQLTGLEYTVTGGKSSSIYSGFVNLVDTPTGFSGGMILQATNDGTGLEFIDATGFLTSEDIVWKVYADKSRLPSAASYHGMFAHVHGDGGAYMAHGGEWHKIWPTEVSFTGLSGTPASFDGANGKYLRVTDDATGIEYVDLEAGSASFTGLSGTPPSFVGANNKYLKVTSDATGIEYVDLEAGSASFTGLSGTPPSFDGGNDKYLKITSDGTGVEYADIDFPENIVSFTGLSGTPPSFDGGNDKYLKITSDGTGVEYADIDFPENQVSFTGLSGTPPSFDGGNDKYLKITADGTGVEYADIDFPENQVSFTGLSGTPPSFDGGNDKYLKITSDGTGVEYADIDFPDNIVSFTGLSGTPGNYNSPSGLLRVTSDGTGIEYFYPESGFTGLHDTPSTYSLNSILMSSSEGIVYTSIPGNTFTGLGDTPTGIEQNQFLIGNAGGQLEVTGDISKFITFTGLSDTPNNWSSNKYLVINSQGNAVTYSGFNNTFTGLIDTPSASELNEGDFLVIDGSDKVTVRPSGNLSKLISFTGLNDTPNTVTDGFYVVGTAGGGLGFTNAKPGAGGTAPTFANLPDTPASFAGDAGSLLRVNQAQNAVEFFQLTAETINNLVTITGSSDTPTGITGDHILVGSGSEFIYKPYISGFTGLADTPNTYGTTGHALRISQHSDIEFYNPTFKGLNDTVPVFPDQFVTIDNETMSGAYVYLTGLKDVDTESFGDKKFLQVQGDFPTHKIVFTGIHFTGLGGVPTNWAGNENKFLALNAGGTALVFADAGGGGGASTFIGLSDVDPANFVGKENQILVVNSSADAVTFTGLNEAFSGNFTGLHDTPTGYSGGYYLKGNETGIEWHDLDSQINSITGATGHLHERLFLTGLRDTPNTIENSKFLGTTAGGEIQWLTVPGGAAAVSFSGLSDTPSEFHFSEVDGQFVIASGDGVVFKDIGVDNLTGVAFTNNPEEFITYSGGYLTGRSFSFSNLVQTPTGISGNKFLRGTSDGTGLEFVDIEFPESTNISGFTGLHDTPTGYLSGMFLRAHHDGTGIEYATPTFSGLADTPDALGIPGSFVQVNSEGDGLIFSTGVVTGSGMITGTSFFTGLKDTPNSITNDRVLFTKSNKINFLKPADLPIKIIDLTDTPAAIEDGKVLVGKAGKLEFQNPSSQYKVISVRDPYAEGQSLIKNEFVTGAHLMTISEGERIEINPNHTAKKDDFKISVTNKTFEIEIEEVKPATSATAKSIISGITYESTKGSQTAPTQSADLNKILNDNLSDFFQFQSNPNIQNSTLTISFKHPIYVHGFYWDGSQPPAGTPWVCVTNGLNKAFSPLVTPKTETANIVAGTTFASLGKISEIKLQGQFWLPKINQIKLAYSFHNVSGPKKYRTLNKEFSDPLQGINSVLNLHRGESYDLHIKSLANPFFIKSKNTVGSADVYNKGVLNNGTTGNAGPITFNVPVGAPETLYYQGGATSTLSGLIKIPPYDVIDQIESRVVKAFTGLSGTPGNFVSDKYLKVTNDGTGLNMPI